MVPFGINSDTRYASDLPLYIPRRGRIKRCDNDRHTRASLHKSSRSVFFANKSVLEGGRWNFTDLVANLVQLFYRNMFSSMRTFENTSESSCADTLKIRDIRNEEGAWYIAGHRYQFEH